MPELPEVEVTRRRIEPFLVGRTVAKVRTGPPSYFFLTDPASLRRRMRGRTFGSIQRRGKYLLARAEDGSRLVLHLGMSGQLFPEGTSSLRLLSATARASLKPEEQLSFAGDRHTHQRGEEFCIEDPAGSRIYDTFIYSDPLVQSYQPPMYFNSPNAADRRLTYCATYNNGVAPDGSPDVSTVRSRSTTPTNGNLCQPVACSDGLVGAPCSGPSDHATCDSVPGADDGFCDACAITAGVTTEDEMFVLITSTFVPEPPIATGILSGLAMLGLLNARRKSRAAAINSRLESPAPPR